VTVARQKLGARGEDLATVFLKKQKYQILQRNFRCKIGEIDIIAINQEDLVFCEVKTRKLGGAHPSLSVTSAKMRKLRKLGLFYIERCSLHHLQPRFDVISIQLPLRGEPILEHFINAF